MRPLNEALADRILTAAKTEFLQKGFRRASVRSIASAAGVTTGALYRYYANKEALFDALVAAPADELYQKYKDFIEAVSARELSEQLAYVSGMMNASEDEESGFRYIYRNYDAFKLIACCAAGTKYEGYAERLVDIETRSTAELVRLLRESGRLGADVDETVVHILAGSMFAAVFEIIAHDEPMETAMRHILTLRDFCVAGWHKILGFS